MKIKLTNKTKIAFSWWSVKRCKGLENWLFTYTHIDAEIGVVYEITFLGFRAGVLFYN